MPGSKASYSVSNCDVQFKYAADPFCVARGWLPTTYDSDPDIPWFFDVHGGGWDGASNVAFETIHRPYTAATDGFYTALLDAGFAVFVIEWRPGINVQIYNRFLPTARYPGPTNSIAEFVQHVKSNARTIMGSDTGALTTNELRIVGRGNSSGAIELSAAALTPDRGFWYQPGPVRMGGANPYIRRFNHRFRGGILIDSSCAFDKFASTAVSAAALARFRAKELTSASTAFAEISSAVKREQSVLPLIEAEHIDNDSLGFFLAGDDGSIPEAQSSPTGGALGSYLGSGTTIQYVTGPVGTFLAGETVTCSGNGTTGTLKGHNTTQKILFIERNQTTVFAGTLTGSTSGATLDLTALGILIGGNNSRLAFLSYAGALSAMDAATLGEVADCTAVHEIAQQAIAYAALLAHHNNGLHLYRIGSDYTASLTPGHLPDYNYQASTFETLAMDWIENTLGITA